MKPYEVEGPLEEVEPSNDEVQELAESQLVVAEETIEQMQDPSVSPKNLQQLSSSPEEKSKSIREQSQGHQARSSDESENAQIDSEMVDDKAYSNQNAEREDEVDDVNIS